MYSIAHCVTIFDEHSRRRFRGRVGQAYWLPAGWRMVRAPDLPDMARRKSWRDSWSLLQWYPLCQAFSQNTTINDLTRYESSLAYNLMIVYPLMYNTTDVLQKAEPSFLTL